eukprot:104211_1
MAEQFAEPLPDRNEYVWEIKDAEWNKWKNAAKGDHFQSDDFELYGTTWCIDCYPNGKQFEGDFDLSLKYKSLGDKSVRINYKFTCQDAVKRLQDEFYDYVDKRSSEYCELCQFNKLKENECNQLTIKLTIQAILIFCGNTNDQFEWIINPGTLDPTKFNEDTTFDSPDVTLADGTKWQLYLVPFDQYETIKAGIQLGDCETKITAATYVIEFVEAGASFRRTYPFVNPDDADFDILCKTMQTRNLNKWTFRCKIITSYEIMNAFNGLNWKISGALMQQFKTAGLHDQFLSPPFTCDNVITWHLAIEPHGYGQNDGFVDLRMIATTSEYELYDDLDVHCWWNITCPELNYVNIAGEQLSLSDEKFAIFTSALWNSAQFNELNEITITCNIETNTKIWKMKKNEVEGNQTEFELNNLKWKMMTTINSVNLKLIEFPPAVNSIQIDSRIICENSNSDDDEICDSKKSVVYCKDNPNATDTVITFDDIGDVKDDEIITFCCIIDTLNGIPKMLLEDEQHRNLLFTPIVVKQSNDIQLNVTTNNDHILYDKHRDIIDNWNQNSSKLQGMSLLHDKLLIMPKDNNNDEKKENEININSLGVKLFDKYFECYSIINQQSTRLNKTTTKHYLLEL